MTQRVYFDLINGRAAIRDDEGVEVQDLDQATEEARAVIDEMRAKNDLSSPEEDWSLVIRGEDGATLKTLPLG